MSTGSRVGWRDENASRLHGMGHLIHRSEICPAAYQFDNPGNPPRIHRRVNRSPGSVEEIAAIRKVSLRQGARAGGGRVSGTANNHSAQRRIYLAGSWKNADKILMLRDILKAEGHEVDCFASTDTGRTSFNWYELTHAIMCNTQEEAEEILLNMDAINLLDFERVRGAYREDRRWLDWSDTCVLVLPSGKSAHLEAGYAVGSGKDLFIFGEFAKGDRDVMYGFATGLFREEEICQMCERLKVMS